MAFYRKAKQRANRRFAQAIFAPGKAMERKPYPPGMHGPTLRRKVSDYSASFSEKQKLKWMFGLNEKQFRRTFEEAKRQRGVTGLLLLTLLETRLDNVVYRLGFASSRRAARQFVGHGHIRVNGHRVTIPSYRCVAGDAIEVCEKTSSRQLATRALSETQSKVVPSWIDFQEGALKAALTRLPLREEMEQGINEQPIVEFYSR